MGIAIGPSIWGCRIAGWPTTPISGATVTNNTLTGVHMGYGIAADDSNNVTITGNISQATYAGTPTGSSCNGATPPAPQAFMEGNTLTGTVQSEFVKSVNLSSLLNLNPTVVPAPLWYLPLSGNTNDASGNGHNGTNIGGSFVNDSFLGRQVISLNGQNACVTVNAPLPASFTKAAWVKLTSLNGAPGIIENGGGSSSQADIFRVAAADLLRPGVITGGVFYHPADDPSTFPMNIWVHVALTFDASTGFYSLYRNGTLVASGTGPAATGVTSEDIGCLTNSTDWWNGYISQAELWNTALSANQIANVYDGATGVTVASNGVSGGTSSQVAAAATSGATLAQLANILTSIESILGRLAK